MNVKLIILNTNLGFLFLFGIAFDRSKSKTDLSFESWSLFYFVLTTSETPFGSTNAPFVTELIFLSGSNLIDEKSREKVAAMYCGR